LPETRIASRAAATLPEYLTIGDAAKLTGYSIKTIRRWADEGKVRFERSPGGHRLINRDDVNALPKKVHA
jgi:excisionase family DNA binding protein